MSETGFRLSARTPNAKWRQDRYRWKGGFGKPLTVEDVIEGIGSPQVLLESSAFFLLDSNNFRTGVHRGQGDHGFFTSFCYMSQKTSFLYREFYDVPRMIIFRREDSLILLESAFEIEADDYSNSYAVFVLPHMSQDELDGSWEGLSARATKFLGHILVRELEFDPTLRKEIDAALIDDLLSHYQLT